MRDSFGSGTRVACVYTNCKVENSSISRSTLPGRTALAPGLVYPIRRRGRRGRRVGQVIVRKFRCRCTASIRPAMPSNVSTRTMPGCATPKSTRSSASIPAGALLVALAPDWIVSTPCRPPLFGDCRRPWATRSPLRVRVFAAMERCGCTYSAPSSTIAGRRRCAGIDRARSMPRPAGRRAPVGGLQLDGGRRGLGQQRARAMRATIRRATRSASSTIATRPGQFGVQPPGR